jgi:hypothetical protein
VSIFPLWKQCDQIGLNFATWKTNILESSFVT